MARRVTKSLVKRMLVRDGWRPDHRNWSYEVRYAHLADGALSIMERRHTGTGKHTFHVSYYIGGDRNRWEGDTFDNIDQAVGYANAHLEEAVAAFEGELAQGTRVARQPQTTDIYPEGMNHGWDEPLAGGTDVMRRVQNDFRREQGLPERPDSPRVAARDVEHHGVKYRYFGHDDAESEVNSKKAIAWVKGGPERRAAVTMEQWYPKGRIRVKLLTGPGEGPRGSYSSRMVDIGEVRGLPKLPEPSRPSTRSASEHPFDVLVSASVEFGMAARGRGDRKLAAMASRVESLVDEINAHLMGREG